jgi:hypothetical protein
MGSKVGSCARGVALLAVFLAVLFQVKLYRERWEGVRDPYSYTWDGRKGATFPRQYPQVYRNVIDVGPCRETEDACTEYWQTRFIEFFGDRMADVVDGRKEVNDTVKYGAFPEEFLTRATIREYFNNPEFDGSDIKFGTGIGVSSEFATFFGADTDGNNLWDRIINDPKHMYIGSQLFVARNKPGTTMHNANTATTLFLNMAGRKRWIIGDPAWMDDMDCVLETRGNYHTCLIPTRPHTDIDAQIRMLRHRGIPDSAWVDVTLDPGDLLLFGSTFPHAIDNHSPVTIGYSLRFGTPPARLGQVRITLRGLARGLYLRLTGYPGVTMFDNFIRALKMTDKFGMADVVYDGGQNPVYRKYLDE